MGKVNTVTNLKVSVVMSVYAEPKKWIAEAINSILNQTYRSYEFIIVNDNPARSENDALLEYYKNKDPRIILLRNDINIGLTKSLNKALRITKGKYIARMDADDIANKSRLQLQVDFLENNKDYVLCGGGVKCIGNIRVNEKLYRYPQNNDSIKIELLFKNVMVHPTLMYRNEILKRYNVQYRVDKQYAQDYWFITELSKYGKFFNFKFPLIKYRISDRQISHAKQEAQNESALEARKMYSKFFNNVVFESKFRPWLHCIFGNYLFKEKFKWYEWFVIPVVAILVPKVLYYRFFKDKR